MPWKPTREIVADVEDLLPAHIHPYIRRTMERFDAANAEIVEVVVGHFDVHGEIMAFDAGAGRLNGLFDFADAGIADYHKEIQATCWISPDLADRIIPRYEALTGRTVDRARVALFQEAGRIVNVAFSKGIRPEVAADFVRRYEADTSS
jgi:aminoglycoside phosphotransferase